MSEQLLLIQTDVELIKKDLKLVETSHQNYPTSEEMATKDEAINFLPETLKVFFKTLMHGNDVDVKLASIRQAIMQAIRPKC